MGVSIINTTFLKRTIYEMKKLTLWSCAFAFLLLGTGIAMAQASDKKGVKVQKRTLMNQFEPDYVLSVQERIALKQSRIAHQYRTKEILDTLDISDAKRKRLIKELKRNPFSERIQETIAKATPSQAVEKDN